MSTELVGSESPSSEAPLDPNTQLQWTDHAIRDLRQAVDGLEMYHETLKQASHLHIVSIIVSLVDSLVVSEMGGQELSHGLALSTCVWLQTRQLSEGPASRSSRGGRPKAADLGSKTRNRLETVSRTRSKSARKELYGDMKETDNQGKVSKPWITAHAKRLEDTLFSIGGITLIAMHLNMH